MKIKKEEIKLKITRDKLNTPIYSQECWNIYLSSNVDKVKVNFGELTKNLNPTKWNKEEYFFGDRLNYQGKMLMKYKDVKNHLIGLYIQFLQRNRNIKII